MLDRRHADRVIDRDAANAARRPGNIGVKDMAMAHVQVPDRHRQIGRLDDNAAGPVHGAQRVIEPDQIAEGLIIPGPAPALDIVDVRRADHRAEIHGAAADMQIAGGIARGEHELARRLGDIRFYQRALHADEL